MVIIATPERTGGKFAGVIERGCGAGPHLFQCNIGEIDVASWPMVKKNP